MKIRIDNPATVRLELRPGDELVVESLSPGLQNLLTSTRADGARFAHLVDNEDDSETATVAAVGQTATTGRGQRREQRSQTVS